MIVATEVTQSSTDSKQLAPVLAQIAMNLEQKTEKTSADASCFSEANATNAALQAAEKLRV